MTGVPPESIDVAYESGWMNAKTFLKWLQHFQQYVHYSAARPVLLILDGHGSHKYLKVIEYARDNHIHMLSTQPHTTHKLQPLDRVFFKPFKQACGSASASWMRKNPGAQLTEYDVTGLVNTVFTKVARLEIAQNGFCCTGIQPFDREIFRPRLLGSALTDIPLIENQTDQSTTQVCHTAATENEPESSTCASTLASSTLQRETPRSSVNTDEVSMCLRFCRLSQTPQRSECL